MQSRMNVFRRDRSSLSPSEGEPSPYVPHDLVAVVTREAGSQSMRLQDITLRIDVKWNILECGILGWPDNVIIYIDTWFSLTRCMESPVLPQKISTSFSPSPANHTDWAARVQNTSNRAKQLWGVLRLVINKFFKRYIYMTIINHF